MQSTPSYFGVIKNPVARIANGDGTALVTFYDPPTGGGKVETIAVTSDDTAARDLQLVVTKGGVDYPICTKTIPITAGQIPGTPAVNILDGIVCPWIRIDENGNPYLILEDGAVLKAKVLTTVTAAKFINLVGQVKE